MKIIATLRHAVTQFGERGEVQFAGRVYGDTLNRFLDGQRLVIGPILDEPEPGVFTTRFGAYLVVPARSAAGARRR